MMAMGNQIEVLKQTQENGKLISKAMDSVVLGMLYIVNMEMRKLTVSLQIIMVMG